MQDNLVSALNCCRSFMLHCDLIRNFVFMCAYTFDVQLCIKLLLPDIDIFTLFPLQVLEHGQHNAQRHRHTCSSHQHR